MKKPIIFPFFALVIVSGLMAAGCQRSASEIDYATKMNAEMAALPQSADDVLIVDCLLPGQVRKLGRMTYLTPRMPTKITAFECGMRGGEYIAFDRSNYKTALRVWLPQAQQGDRLAQTYVGEIYMKGLGIEPQYEQAIQWFEKAAGQGFERAQVNLGYLYEMGLGVPRDSKRALNLYREATGLEQAIAFEADLQLSQEKKAELERLRQEVDQHKEESQKLQHQLDRVKLERNTSEGIYIKKIQAIEAEKRQLKKARVDLNANQVQLAESAALEKLTRELSTREARMEDLREQATRLQVEIARMQRKKAKISGSQVEGKNQILEEISQQENELRSKRMKTERLNEEITALEQRKVQLSETITTKMKDRESALEIREAKLLLQRKETERLKKEIATLDLKASEYRKKIDTYQVKVAKLPGPEIEILDPRPLDTRGKKVIEAQAKQNKHQIVGKVTAPAGLYSFRVNDTKQSVKDNGLFKVLIPLTAREDTQVKIVAVDGQGKMGHYMLTISRPVTTAHAKKETPITSPTYDFGRYYAMVIGNNAYKGLPPLETAVNDAKAVSETLKTHYGFDTTLLINATRYDIYATLEKFRKKLTEKDNFLIYYAGHGELDKKNRRGYWLPVDADPNSHVNSISNQAVTDILNNMSVKQAIVIADTCYSGIMTRSVIAAKKSGMTDEARFKWYTKIASERSRTVLSSGGLKPVLDAGIGEHSIFANALMDVLNDNNTILEASELHRMVRSRVSSSSKQLGLEQIPQYSANLHAGHKSGDFLFVPKKFQKKLLAILDQNY